MDTMLSISKKCNEIRGVIAGPLFKGTNALTTPARSIRQSIIFNPFLRPAGIELFDDGVGDTLVNVFTFLGANLEFLPHVI